MLKLLLRAPVMTASGYGVHSRQILKALLASGAYDVSVMACNWGNTSYILDREPFHEKIRELVVKHEMEKVQGTARYDVSVQVTIPNEFQRFARVNIGVTAGIEVDRVSPEWIKKINENVDLVVVPSKHSRDTLMVGYNTPEGPLQVRKPVVVCQEGADTATFNTDPPAKELIDRFKLEAPFNYLFVGLGLDKGMGEDRKNLSMLVKWFCERFKDDPNVGLVIKGAMVNGSLMDYEVFTRRVREIKESTGCGRYPRIQVIHGKLSDAELAALYKHPQVKALVSLTHGEGYGLPLLEAAACGLPVVATDWSGHLDFLTIGEQKKFVRLEHDLGEIPESVVWNGVMEKGSRWANVKEDDVKLKLKKLTLSYDRPKEWATQLAAHVAENFSEEKTGRHFSETVRQFLEQHDQLNPQNEEQAVAVLRKRFSGEGKKTLIYTMPMSAGDVFISTAIVSSLRKKFPEHRIFFATDGKYADILKDNPDIDVAFQFEPQWMMNVPLLERVFDEVYTPNLAIQTTTANWVKRGKGRLLGQEMAHLCDVEFGEYRIKEEPVDGLPKQYIVLNPGSGKGQWEARNYLHWQEVVNNLVRCSGLPVVQVGVAEDPEYKGVVDLRGKTNYNQLYSVVKNAACLVSIDSVTSHMADAAEVPQVSLYGSSYSTSTGPVDRKKLAVLMDTPSRYSCDKACYKYQCSVDKDHPCINEIPARQVVLFVLQQVQGPAAHANMSLYEEYRPTISGYTHVLNPAQQDFPWQESIGSMLGFCDQVVVVDGGSTDGTLEKLKAWASREPKLEIVERPWDWSEPGMDGMQKAYGRAMCTGEFLWQQDSDEVVHEDDYEKIRKLVKRFPKDVDLLDLPVVELWGDAQHCRTDRHTWKWRLSRNDFRITHGIVKEARVTDEKTGKTYARKGMSDGCEYINMMDYTYIPHRGFYDQNLENTRITNPEEFGRRMNGIYRDLPSVYHYSWCDIPRKIRNFRDFWDKCWSNLYNDPAPRPRFPDVKTEEDVARKAEEMRVQGGEHQKAQTFVLERTNPAIMEGWLTRNVVPEKRVL